MEMDVVWGGGISYLFVLLIISLLPSTGQEPSFCHEEILYSKNQSASFG